MQHGEPCQQSSALSSSVAILRSRESAGAGCAPRGRLGRRSRLVGAMVVRPRAAADCRYRGHDTAAITVISARRLLAPQVPMP